MSLDEEGICETAFEHIFAFDEVISLGHRENVTVAQVKQYCEMESHEEKLFKLVQQSKINETKDLMKRKANEIDKSKVCTKRHKTFYLGLSPQVFSTIFCLWNLLQIEKNRGEKGGYMSLQSMGSGRVENSFSDMSISGGGGGGGFGSGSSFGLSSDTDSFSTKPKGLSMSACSFLC